MVDRGFDSKRLAERFAELFDASEADLGRLIRAGFYRFTAAYPSDQPEAAPSVLETELETGAE